MDSSSVCILCKCWESVLQHGLKHSSQPVSTFKYVHLVTLRLCFKYYLFSLVVIVLPFYFCIAFMGYWHQRADKKLGDIPRYPGVFFSGQRQDGRPEEDPWWCTASVCVTGVHCWEIYFG